MAADGGDPYAEPSLDAPGPAEGAAPPDLRGLAAHTFDAYVRRLCGAVPADPEAPAPTTTLELHVTLPALCGASDDPAFLEGYGWLPAWLVRRGLPWATCRIRRVLTDPFTGDLITVDGHTYPASWLTDPGPPSPGGSSGGAPPPPEDPPNPSAGTFRGQPLQDLPPTRTEDEALGPAVETSGPPTGAPPPPVDDTTSHAADPCDDGTCAPASPHDCPVSAVEGGGPYAPTTLLDRVVRRRWERCTHPGCTRRASRCDVDHVVAHRREGTATGGGTTCACNLEPKCRRHHLLKHGFPGSGDPAGGSTEAASTGWVRWSARWRQWRCEGGSSHWRSPLGYDHRSRPRPTGPPAERFRLTPWPPRDPDAELLAGRRHPGAPLTVVAAEGPPARAAPVVRVRLPDEPDS